MEYGLGKFEACGNYALLAQYLYENHDEEIGDCETFGWYAKHNGRIKGVNVFAIINEDSQGFVTVDYFDDAEALYEAWDKIEAEYTHLNRLLAGGFDESWGTRNGARAACSQCQALVINGTATHEHGCINAVHECNGCNELIPARQSYCQDCA